MATKRKRLTKDLEIPELSRDAGERKRVLNVLAQRRYRERKRERLAALEKELKQKNSDGNSPGGLSTDSEAGQLLSNSPDSFHSSAQSRSADHHEKLLPPTPPSERLQSQGPLLNLFVNQTVSECVSDILEQPDFLDLTPEDTLLDLELTNNTLSLDSVFALSPPLPSSSIMTEQLLSNPTNLVKGIDSNLLGDLQTHQASTFTFPDERIIEIPTFALLNAVLTIASRLDLMDNLWEVASISPIFTGCRGNQLGSLNQNPPLLLDLPENFRPTPTQRLIPHHPVLDLLPWPTVRDKLIQVFSLPPHLRPAPAADPMGLVSLVYDIEDPTEGLRVSGPDPFMANMWEVGQHVFQRWWWAFEGSIVERSNRLRRERGLQGLVIGTVE
ncbi:hypothetical protein LOZ58_002462 [Ophidiomyces ophidiicola]|nr:hypothetical protein LOZ65_004869 [Ophidiomyces ophidiicola]KAI1962839.1 hypothetical protein LOZ58_002462 [Ophidiomyces ophidiicola]